jgi:GTP:adenosylcobinamide-phosphate guanylyltransferase
VYLLYLDDAGSPANAAENYFVLGGICVFEAQVEWFGREIDKLAAAYNAATPEDIEFHASANGFEFAGQR